MLWDQRVPKRLVQAFNGLGISMSYSYQTKAVKSVGADVVRRACQAAADERQAKMLAYDNFNWRYRAWEVSASHGSMQHDQVSAMLIILHVNKQLSPAAISHLTDIRRFDEQFGTRHSIPPEKSFRDIIPSKPDHQLFRQSSILHVASILSVNIPAFSKFASDIPPLTDPSAIPPHQTELYCLPTFDQEQASTRGNMVVLSHYFLDVLRLPKSIFERIMFFILGDRLTTSRDRAAQDQRAVDRSPHRIDRLSCFSMTSGLMHQCLNMVQNLAQNFWGESSTKDNVSLLTLRDLLPNRADVNPRKIDFYGWLRFLDVVLSALVVSAALAITDVDSTEQLAEGAGQLGSDILSLSATLVDSLLLPSMDWLEAENTKTVIGQSNCGHAVLLMHDLMTLREMRYAIKHGHPERILRTLKFWTPMFYAGGSYNYSHECMELIHNLVHDWPKDSAQMLLAGMLINTSGRADGFKEGDLGVEHLNDNIKARAHGVNASPHLLEKITPAIGQVQELTINFFEELGVESVYQHHTHVRQTEDIKILTKHFIRTKIFHFTDDKASEHPVIDLYRTGLHRLAGLTGGHAKHLTRHKLRLRTRLTTHGPTPDIQLELEEDELTAQRELLEAQDSGDLHYTIEDSERDIELDDLDDDEDNE